MVIFVGFLQFYSHSLTDNYIDIYAEYGLEQVKCICQGFLGPTLGLVKEQISVGPTSNWRGFNPLISNTEGAPEVTGITTLAKRLARMVGGPAK